MYHIVYQSTAVGVPTTADLRQLLRHSRTKNYRLSVTGLLLYGNGSFMQVLEGEAATVQQLYAAIQHDYRHTRVIKLADGPVPGRIFADWSMGFQALSGDDFMRLTGYIDPYRASFLDAQRPAIDEEMLFLLKSFVVNDGYQL